MMMRCELERAHNIVKINDQVRNNTYLPKSYKSSLYQKLLPVLDYFKAIRQGEFVFSTNYCYFLRYKPSNNYEEMGLKFRYVYEQLDIALGTFQTACLVSLNEVI